MVDEGTTTALVTGGRRGVGRGIAEELAASGATVYVTGRGSDDSTFPENCTPIPCDHTEDAQVAAAFDRIHSSHGRLDVLVNNVWGGYENMVEGDAFTWDRPFWQQDLSRWDSMFAAGVRAHYVASTHAAGPMVSRGRGLIVNISYWAAQKYMANVPYGVSKAATDKMTNDMAHELLPHGVTVVSLYPGLVRTEKVMAASEHLDLSNSESPAFVGRAVVALANDPNVLEKTGRVLLTAQCAEEYNFTDLDGTRPTPLSLLDA